MSTTVRRKLHPLLSDYPSSILRDAALAPATLRAYNNNLVKFLRYTRLTLFQLLQLSAATIDRRLAAYIDHLYSTQGSYDYACQAMFGLIYRAPSLRLRLGEARLRLRGWKRLKTQRSHPPITWELTVLFATTMAKWGHHAHAVATLLAFDCYLRVGELTRIDYKDIVMPNDPRVGAAHRGMAVRLAKTKTGNNQWVSLQKPEVAQVLLHYLRTFPFMEHERVFPFTPASFRKLLHQVAASLGLGHIPYVPHSFRHGGATCDFLKGATIEQIMFRGRWVAMESARRYIQTARALLIIQRVPARLNACGAALAQQLLPTMRMLMESVRWVRRVHFARGL